MVSLYGDLQMLFLTSSLSCISMLCIQCTCTCQFLYQINSLDETTVEVVTNGNHEHTSTTNGDHDIDLKEHFPTDENDVILLDEYMKQKTEAVACK